jgi:glyoxylase-like metal-dependent hydrolase (beta-lactamase superfamily II)
MQEITHKVFIENSYLGVTLGAINLAHGLLLIDAPPRPEDVRSWRASLLNLGGSVERLLVNLDAHTDRTLGVRAMECTVLAHEKTAQVFRNRPTAFKSQDVETGADWELCSGLGSIRWAPPEITLTHHMFIHWDDQPVIIEHHPGSHVGAIWVTVPEEKVCFVGDAILPNQPPFLAGGELSEWLASLELLLSPAYQDTLIIGGRTGLVTREQVKAQINFLRLIESHLIALAGQKAPPEATASLIPELLDGFNIPEQRQEQYAQRLKWGLFYYYTRHYRISALGNVEE